MTIFEAIIIAVVEGVTEFLPISSTGHMIIASSLLGTGKEDFTKIFEVAIQVGAILAVVVLYWRKFFAANNWRFYFKLFIAVIPALLLGSLFSRQIESFLGSPTIVAVTMLAGGFVLVFVDKLFKAHTVDTEAQLSYRKSFVIGCWQVISMLPGVSRSAATIIGGMQQGLSRKLAAEFSFYLAVPTMVAATGYTLFLKDWGHDGLQRKGFELIMASKENIQAFVVGNIVAFVVAILAIRFFIGYLTSHGFKLFGIYRIVAGVILLIMLFFGVLER